ncbi:MAG TPA: hypothetical protein VMQ63_08080 [Stellaceae bacterium]|nr:hypothetical protein [Stellaceae bacterium]
MADPQPSAQSADPAEAQRLAALRRYQILDTPPEAEFDDIVKLAAQICDAPIALISLIDKRRQWFKAKHGTDLSETPLSMSICATALTSRAWSSCRTPRPTPARATTRW